MLTIIVAVLAVAPVVTPWQGLSGQIGGYLVMALFPGLALHLLVARERRPVECLLASVVLSPVLVAAAGALMMLSGLDAGAAARWLVLSSALAATAVALMAGGGRWVRPPETRQLWLLAALTATFCALAGYLPLSDHWWQYWSDAWFHGAVVHQIDAWGVPPQDPYFTGLDLQYMWIYHVLVLMVSHGSGIGPLVVMPLLNLSGLVAFILSAYLLSTLFKKSFASGILAVLFVVLAMNAVVWAFLPLKLARALLGEMRGWAEVVRNYSVTPFDKETVWTFLRFYNNQPFLLNKFIVSTALSLAMGFMGVFWYACVAYIKVGRAAMLVLVVISAVGMLSFHTAFGVATIGGLGAGLVLLALARHGLHDFSQKRIVTLAVATLLAALLSAPYLYSVVHLKETDKLIPIGLSFAKSGGILVSCALVIVLAAFQIRPLLATRTAGTSFLVYFAFGVFIVSNLIKLPGINTYDKLPFFVHYPLAIIASWVFADRYCRRHASSRHRRRVVAAVLLLLLPVNTFAWLAYRNTPTGDPLTAQDKELTEWVQKETPRDAIFFENNDRVLLLLTGPRRYYWGRIIYADNWGSPREEMEHRRHVRDNIYSEDALNTPTLTTLGSMASEVYVVIRDNEDRTTTMEKFNRYPALFEVVFRIEDVVVLKLDRAACLEAAGQVLSNPTEGL